ncbi:MAG: Fe-S cluster assembly ATPase SufC [Candidatus Levybacteria bacterium]|nr:Fe-S cluster assembly ATPase SufC [Candidatus Levybacteria bacterium]MDZ4228016.1 Fe-S cluster assembly ATPase SufC [Candidatus Levybacteria bacterium]
MKKSLIIDNLHVSTIDGKEILKGISLTIKQNEIHAVMGPNGGGKSTLAQAVMGHPGFIITKGKILVNGKNITKFSPDKRAKLGIFLGFQYPVEVPGVNFASFLRMAANENKGKLEKSSPIAFRNLMTEKAKKLAFSEDVTKRFLNEGFSGGEKKKAEILQMALLKPSFAILDEPDSGLDVDGLKYISKTITSLDFPVGIMLITHYQRILHYLRPNFVHILINGKIIKSGDVNLAKTIEKNGYEKLLKD